MAEIFEDFQDDNDKYSILTLLDETIKLDDIIPISFVTHFHTVTGKPRKHQLYPMLKAFLIQRVFSIPTDTLSIYHFKDSFCVADHKTQNKKTLHADFRLQILRSLSNNGCRQNPSAQVSSKFKAAHCIGLSNFINHEFYFL